MFAPYMITVAGRAAGCADPDETCTRTVDVLGLHLAAGSLPFYLTSFATIASAFLLPVVGAFVDRSSRKKMHMAAFAWAGSFFTALLFFVQGDNWQLGAVAIVRQQHPGRLLAGQLLRDPGGHLHRGGARPGLVRGWAWGYLGGGLLLAGEPGDVPGARRVRDLPGLAVRLSLLSAALWWAGFTLIPVLRLRDYPARNVVAGARRPAAARASDSCGRRCARCGSTR